MKSLVQENAYPVLSDDGSSVNEGENAIFQAQAQSAQFDQELEQAQTIAQALHGMQGFIMQSGDQGLTAIDTEALQVATEKLCSLMNLDYTKELSFESFAALPLRNKFLSREALTLAQEGLGEKIVVIIARAVDWLMSTLERFNDRADRVLKGAAALKKASNNQSTTGGPVSVAPSYLRMLTVNGQLQEGNELLNSLHRLAAQEGDVRQRMVSNSRSVVTTYRQLLEAVGASDQAKSEQLFKQIANELKLVTGRAGRVYLPTAPEMRSYVEPLPLGGWEVLHTWIDENSNNWANLSMVQMVMRKKNQEVQVPETIESLDFGGVNQLADALNRLVSAAGKVDGSDISANQLKHLARLAQGLARKNFEDHQLATAASHATMAVTRFFTQGMTDRRNYILTVAEAALAVGIASVKQGASDGQ